MYVTRKSMATAVSNLNKHLESVTEALTVSSDSNHACSYIVFSVLGLLLELLCFEEHYLITLISN